MKDGVFYLGLIRLHVLHHAAEEPIFGAGISAELARHGYRLGAGTLYPLLHGLEEKGYIRAQAGPGRERRYVATARGRQALARAREKVRELFAELVEEAEEKPGARGKKAATRSRVARRSRS